MIEKPKYDTYLTPEIRYNSELTSTEKVLYSDLLKICELFGCCTLKPRQFADLYGLSSRSVQRSFSNLANKGFIRFEFDRYGDRIIYVCSVCNTRRK